MISPNLISSLIIIGVLIIVLSVIGNKVSKLDPKEPLKGPLFIIVSGIGKLNDMIQTYFGKNWKLFAPILIAVFIYLIFANTSSLIGLNTPLSNINIAISFSLLAFLIIQVYGMIIRTPKKRMKDLMSPSILLFPINLIGEISTPLAMGLRLFGNLLSGAVIGVIVFYIFPGLLGIVSVIPMTVVVHPIFNIGFGLIQAFVYFMLLTIFLSMAVEAEEA